MRTTQKISTAGRFAAAIQPQLQICNDLSVSLRLTAPLKGEPWGAQSIAFPS